MSASLKDEEEADGRRTPGAHFQPHGPPALNVKLKRIDAGFTTGY